MRLKVSSIDPATNKENLQQLFSRFGDVSSIKLFRSATLTDAPALGYIIMQNEKEAKTALQKLNGKMFGSLPLKIEWSSESFSAKKNTTT